MNIEMHTTLERFFAATNQHDVAGLTRDLTDDAIVKDEGHEHRGVAAIRAWAEETFQKYDYTVEPTRVARENGRIAVGVRAEGSFPGSPISLTYRFKLAGQKIAHVEVG